MRLFSNEGRSATGIAVGISLIFLCLLDSHCARAQPATVDPTFVGSVSGGAIYKISLLSDGKILIGGTFSTVNASSQQGIARLQTNGMRDPSFSTTVSYGINDFAIDASNRIVLGGEFTRVNSAPMTNLARILPNGWTDESFFATANGIVDAVALQPDGHILVGGAFSQISYAFQGAPRNRITRLNSDSSDDGTFASTDRGSDSTVFAFAVQPDGKVLVGGAFHTFDGQLRPYLVRLNSDMTFDPGYVPNIDGPIYGLTLTPDGKAMAYGGFQRVGGVDRPMLARLNTDGSLDASFDAGLRLYGGNVYTAVFDSAGRLYIAGSFSTVRGAPRDGFARLHSNGDLDTGFYPPPTIDGYINAIAVLPNDDLIIGGTFLGYGGLFTPRIARVHGGFAPPSAPAIVRQSTNATVRAGDDTAFVVDATGGPRLYYQWQLYGTNLIGETRATLQLNDVLPQNGGSYSVIVSNELGTVTSEPIVLTVSAAAPVFTIQPTNKVAFFGQTVRFSGNATGAPNPTLQWQFDGTNIPAAGGSILILSNVNYSHAGDYTVVASNAVGVSTSAVAQLTVNPPATNAGAVDLGFIPLPGFVSQSISVSAAAVQPDGRLIVAGAGRLRRLLSDGSLDTTFNTNSFYDASVYSIALQPDKKVVIGGSFSQLNGVSRYRIARLGEDGTLDTNFNAILGISIIRRIIVQPDGRVLFASDAGANLGNVFLGRLLPDGGPDPNFKPQVLPPADGGVSPASISVYDLALQPDGKILLASSAGFRRFLSHGALDIGFNPPTNNFPQVSTIGLQADGKILVTGSRPNTNSPPLLRLSPDGSLDATFGPQFSDGLVQAVALQPDGRILTARLLPNGIPGGPAGGQVSGTAFERLNTDGSFDASYTTTTASIGGLPRILLRPNCEIIVIGSFTSFNSYDRVGVVQLHSDPPAPPQIVHQPAPQNIAAGQTAKFSADVSCVPEPHIQWQKDGQPIPGATSQLLSILNVHAADAGQYTLLLSNALGVVTSAPAALVVGPAPTNGGALDASFYSGAGPNDSVYAAIQQPDGKIVIGGLFSSVDGIARSRIARLNADGSLDPSFDPGSGFGGSSIPAVQALALLPNGKILAGGLFGSFNGVSANSLVRLNSDGSLDLSFRTNALTFGATVSALALQPDGKVLCGSDAVPRLDRFLANGNRDPAFSSLNSGQVRTLALRSDGRIIVGGSTLPYAGSFLSLARLTTNGVFEASPAASLFSTVLAVALVGNDAIVAAGTSLTRLDSNFNVVTGAWQAVQIKGSVSALGLDSCGRVLAGGTMTNVNGVACRGLVRLFDDGIVDFSFTPPLFDGRVRAILSLTNSRLLAAGDFAEVSGASRPGVVKLIEEASGRPIFRWEPLSGTNLMGQDILLSTAVTCPPHTTYQWQFNGANLLGQTNDTLLLRNVRGGAAGDYRLIARNDFGAITSATATITLAPAPANPGNNDIEFYPPLVQSESMGPIALQADGRLLVVHGPSGTVAPIYRYNQDGSRDNSFASSVVEPQCLVVARNGDIFVSAGGTLKKLHSDGSPDENFVPSISGGIIENTVIQPDGKVVVVGSFTTVNAVQRRRVARLNPGGSLDASFNPGAGLDNTAYSVALQADGKILVGGIFTNALNFFPRRPFLVRLNADGALDTTFNSGFTSNTWVFALAVMSDGRIVVGGTFTQYAGQSRTSVLRLHSDGSLDSSFTAALQGRVLHMALQRDGKVLAAGEPLRFGTNRFYAVVRLRPDGAADPDFVQAQIEWGTVGPFGISGLALDPDGKIYASGRFTRYDGFPRFGLVRLHGNPVVFAPSFNVGAFSTSMYIESGRTYFLESTPGLNPPAWTVLDSVSGNNAFYTFNDPSPAPSRRFYRVRVE